MQSKAGFDASDIPRLLARIAKLEAIVSDRSGLDRHGQHSDLVPCDEGRNCPTCKARATEGGARCADCCAFLPSHEADCQFAARGIKGADE